MVAASESILSLKISKHGFAIHRKTPPLFINMPQMTEKTLQQEFRAGMIWFSVIPQQGIQIIVITSINSEEIMILSELFEKKLEQAFDDIEIVVDRVHFI